MGLPRVPRMKPTREENENGMRTLGARLARAAAEKVVGRERELALVAGAGAPVTFVHGLGGIGKSAFLAALEERLGERVLRLDGRTIEPTPRGFLEALGMDERPREPFVALVDEYDRLRLLDPWLRHHLFPACPEGTRWVLAGRFAPASSWLTTPEWSDLVMSLRLDVLDDAAARQLLARRGIHEADMDRALRLANGHPLALELASRLGPESGIGEAAVLDELAERCLDGVAPAMRDAVEAMALVRRATRPLLEAMLARPCPVSVYDELTELPFVERTPEGLVVHDCVRAAIASRLRIFEPDRHRALSEAAWDVLDATLSRSSPTGPEAWQLTADLLFVLRRPEIREAFFPEHETDLAVDEALRSDHDALFDLVRARESEEMARILGLWWDHDRQSFQVARDRSGVAVGFSIVVPSDEVMPTLAEADPLLSLWLADVADRPALFVRRMVTRGEDASGVLWMAAKRAYVQRPTQWALYATARPRDVAMFESLGYRDVPIAWRHDRTMRLEFGAAGIWTWLRKLVGDGRSKVGGFHLDVAQRQLVVDGDAVPLTPLEHALMTELLEARGAVVTRDELLGRVWKQRNTGSNVVDAVVRLLRKKLGPYAAALETAKGHGYRLHAISAVPPTPPRR